LPAEPTIRDRLLTTWAGVVTRHPFITLALAALLTALSLSSTLTRLEFKSDRSDLIDPSLPWQRRYADFKKKFPRWDDALVVIDRGETDSSRAAADAFINALDARLRANPRFAAVIAGFPRRDAPPTLLLTQPLARVQETVDRLAQSGPVLAAPTLDGLLAPSQLGGTSIPEPQRAGLKQLLERVHAVGAGLTRTSILALDETHDVERFLSSTGRLATILVPVGPDLPHEPRAALATSAEDGVNSRAASIRALRAEISALTSRNEFSSVAAGVTGVPVLESDETALSMRDAALASFISLALIALLMLIAYRGVVVPALAVISLLIGMAWSFAWASLAVGHLQLLSVTFASMLLGLGIDVAIHLIARLELVHADHDHLGDAIAQAFRGVGPGILTASLTIAAASAAMAFTRFAGVAEMGLIAAGGMILCTLAILCCLPAMFMLMPKPEDRLRSHHGGESRPYMGSLGLGIHRHPAPVLVASLAAVVIVTAFASGVRYDTDLQKLMPTTTESVVWQRRLESDDEKSVWHAVALARTADEAREFTDRLRALDTVSHVGGAAVLVPPEPELQAKRDLLARLPDVAPMLAAQPTAPPSATEVDAFRKTAASLAKSWKDKDPPLAAAAAAVAAMTDDEVDLAMAAYVSNRRELLATIAALRDARMPAPDELPAALRRLLFGADASYLLTIYPKASPEGGSVLSPDRLEPFASAVLDAVPHATGPAIQIYESSRLITSAYIAAGFYSLAAILVLLILDFGVSRKGVIDTLCALVPVFGGGAIMLALMRAASVPLNFANMIVLPLLIGIGVGCGVHAVRRWRLQPNDHPLGLAGGSGRAITLTTITTIFGFAAMMTGEHRGIWSLGFVMSVGLAAVWAVTILVLPALLRLRKA
jgi:hypothetical protein